MPLCLGTLSDKKIGPVGRKMSLDLLGSIAIVWAWLGDSLKSLEHHLLPDRVLS